MLQFAWRWVFLWTFVFVYATGHDCWVCTQSPIWSRFDRCVPSFCVWVEPLIHVIRTVRVAAVLTKDCSFWFSIYLSYRTWLHWQITPLNTIMLTDKETELKHCHQAKHLMRSTTFSNRKIYILSPIQQAGQSRLEFQSIYSILFDWEWRWGILSSRDPAIHARGDRAQFRFTESPCNHCALLLPWICCQHSTTHQTHSLMCTSSHTCANNFPSKPKHKQWHYHACLQKRDHSVREVHSLFAVSSMLLQVVQLLHKKKWPGRTHSYL